MEANNEKPPMSKVASVIKIPGYKIKGVLGRGGMAVVYLAEQESIGREVALKVLAPDHTDDTFSERFLTEAKIISQLSHPGIVTVYDAGVHQGNHYMAMEYVKGKTLSDARDELSLAQRVDVIKQMADALDYAGSKGYVHRDIKPENIMCHEDGRAILMDFGIARGMDTTKGLTVTGKAIGTPYYMSPEQTKGLKVDPRSDIYSLGVVLFQVLAGRVPYDGPSFVAVGIKHISEPTPVLPPSFEAFQQIINNSMSKEPGHRYQTAGEMKKALKALPESVFQKQPTQHSKASAQTHSTRTVVDTTIQPATSKAASKKARVSKPVSTQSARQSVPSFRAKRDRQDLPPIDITASDDFKRLRRRRWLLYTLLLTVVAYAGYHRQDLWMPKWQYELAPWLATNIPQSKEILKYLPPAKERPESIVKMPVEKSVERTVKAPVAAVSSSQAETEKEIVIVSKDSDVVLEKIPEQDKQKLEPVKLTPEQEQHNKIQKLRSGMDEHSENALKLAILYRSTLVHDRQNLQATQGLIDLESWFAKTIRKAINIEEWEKSRLLLNMLRESFPAAVQKEHFRYMELQTESAEKLKVYLHKAEQYMQANRMIKPLGANALEEYNKALLLAPDSPKAKQGVFRIANYFYEQARQRQKAKDIQAAVNATNAGLQAVKDHKGLLALKDELQYSVKHQQNILSLLDNAKAQQVNGHLISPRGKSAYDLYQVVLSESPGNPVAVQGLERIEGILVQRIQNLIKQGQFQQANEKLQTARQYYRNSRALDFLQRKLTSETYRVPATVN